MAPGGHFLRCKHAPLDVFVKKITIGVGGHGAVGRQVATLGADDEFVARESLVRQHLQCGADVALAALETIIDRRIKQIDSREACFDERRRVTCVGTVRRLAEIRAGSERRDGQHLRLSKVPLGGDLLESLRVAFRAFRRCTLGHRDSLSSL